MPRRSPSSHAETDPDRSIDLSPAAPGFAAMMGAMSGAQIRHADIFRTAQPYALRALP